MMGAATVVAQTVWQCRQGPIRLALATRGPRGARPGMPRVRFFPAIETEAEFLDTYYKVLHFMPTESVGRVTLPIAFQPSFPLDDPSRYPVPDYVGALPAVGRRDVVVRHSRSRSLFRALLGADLVYVLDWSVVPPGGSASESPRVLNADRHRNAAEGWTWAEHSYRALGPGGRERLQAESQRRFNAYVARLPRYDKAYIFGTGPSLDLAWDRRFDDGYRIVCNTIVRNRALLDHLRPHFILAGDAVYHFSCNRHSQAFRADLAAAIAERDLLFVTRDSYLPLFLRHHPNARARTVGARFIAGNGNFRRATRELLYYPYGNILTSLMLPLAAMLADEVFLLGFDGRSSRDRGFWGYSNRNAYADLLDSIQRGHPGFGRKTEAEYVAYSEMHANNIEKLLATGEASGKRYISLNASHIPALQRRHVGAGSSHSREETKPC